VLGNISISIKFNETSDQVLVKNLTITEFTKGSRTILVNKEGKVAETPMRAVIDHLVQCFIYDQLIEHGILYPVTVETQVINFEGFTPKTNPPTLTVSTVAYVAAKIVALPTPPVAPAPAANTK
jgi:hypothetical protein